MEDGMRPAGWVHALPGRLRVRATVIKRAPALATAAEHALRQERGILDVTANPVTASILIHYDPERTSSEFILARLAELGFAATAPAPSSLSQLSSQLGKTLGKELVKIALAELLSCGPVGALCALI
jgi:hypothetical protein